MAKYQFVWRYQPLKAIYLTCVFAEVLFIRLPLWSILAMVPAFRPRRSWTYKRTVLMKAVQSVLPAVFKACLFKLVRVNPWRYTGREDKVGLVWIEPTSGLIVGEIEHYAKLNGVSASRIPAYWYGEREIDTGIAGQHARADEKVILYLHSGGWIMGDASPDGPSAIMCREVLSRYPQFSRLLSVEYRLCQGPPLPQENPFPTALIDGVTAYNYLVNTLGFASRNILIMGDSAGALTAFDLGRYIATAALPALPSPGGLFLQSPQTDWGPSHTHSESSMLRNRSSDWIDDFECGYCFNAIRGALPASDASQNAWISPASLDLPVQVGLFTGMPPTLILAGDAEIAFDAMVTVRDRMLADGVEVEFIVVPDAPHIFLSVPFHKQERDKAYKMMAPWMDAHFA